jgi:hypothetical protein
MAKNKVLIAVPESALDLIPDDEVQPLLIPLQIAAHSLTIKAMQLHIEELEARIKTLESCRP